MVRTDTSTDTRRALYDIAVIGAGPVGLAIASELALLGFDVLVVDRRPPLAQDTGVRAQLLVARANDLANLADLGIDVSDRSLVSPISLRRHLDLFTGDSHTVEVSDRERNAHDGAVFGSAYQPPVALVPIGRLQRALLAQATDNGATVLYNCKVTRIKRHARFASLQLDDAPPLRAKLAIVATGAARALVSRNRTVCRQRTMIAGVFAHNAPTAQWTRAEIRMTATGSPVRCTMLATGADTAAGTALLVDAPLDREASSKLLRRYFDVVADELGCDHRDFRAPPQVFGTAITWVDQRVVSGDNRAPVLIAGDAAQTGHVFTGLNCFVNLEAAIDLCQRLAPARDALLSGKLTAPALTRALDQHQLGCEQAAAVLTNTSRPHFTAANPGTWALP